jgi:hypothetical protein
MFFLKIPTKRQPELSKLAGLLILLHSLYGTNLLLVSGHDFSRAAPRPKGQGVSPRHRKIRTNFQRKKRRG